MIGSYYSIIHGHLSCELTVMESPMAPTTLMSAGVNSLTVVFIM